MASSSSSAALNQQLFWTRLNQAVSAFCLDVSQRRVEPENKIVCSLVGDELEWCGAHSFLFMASRYLSTTRKIQETEQRCRLIESSLSSETQNVSQLRKQLKQAQLAAEDNDWQLQEHMEKESNNELRATLSTTQAKLVEVEMFLNSENGAMALQLEEELAAAKMKIAELEAEKDDLELRMRRLGSSAMVSRVIVGEEGKENTAAAVVPRSFGNSSSVTFASRGGKSNLMIPSLPSNGGAYLSGFSSLLDD
jgi:cell division protein FtsL